MKNWKDKVLGIFAGIGLMSLLMGNYAQQPKGVWEMHFHEEGAFSHYYSINTQTGEVRKYEDGRFIYNEKMGKIFNNRYFVMEEFK